MSRGKQKRSGERAASQESAASAGIAPGKRTRTERLARTGQVQRKPATGQAQSSAQGRPASGGLDDPSILAAHGFFPAEGGGSAAPVQARGAGGGGALECSTANAGAEANASAPAASVRAGDGLAAAREGREYVGVILNGLIPAYRRAVDALDGLAALQLATVIIEAYDGAVRGEAAAHGVSEQAAQAEVCTVAEAAAEHEALVAELGQLGHDMQALEQILALELGPQMFRGAPVLGSIEQPAVEDMRGFLVAESSTVVNLLIAAAEVRELLGGGAGHASAEARKAAVSRIEPWRARPVNFRFLQRALEAEGCWALLGGVEGASGQTLAATSGKVEKQERTVGALLDAGAWDAAQAEALLSRGATDWAVTDGDAQQVFEMLVSAAPNARARLVEQLAAMGKLEQLCANLPWRWVEALHNAVDEESARALLRPYFENEGGGQSLGKTYEDQVMGNLAAGNHVRAFL